MGSKDRWNLITFLDKVEPSLLKGQKAKVPPGLLKPPQGLDRCGALPDRNDVLRDCPPQIAVRGLWNLLDANLAYRGPGQDP